MKRDARHVQKTPEQVPVGDQILPLFHITINSYVRIINVYVRKESDLSSETGINCSVSGEIGQTICTETDV